ncbi:MAG: hypothetical protein V3T83_09390 [Acidobacteriota bacterium]
MPTHVDQSRLEAWKGRLPERLHIFLENFFGTCEPYDPEVNYLNYWNDVRLYGATTLAYREHPDDWTTTSLGGPLDDSARAGR